MPSKPEELLFVILILLLSASSCLDNENASHETRKYLKEYNVTWDTPSKDYNGSMPLGNGDIGLNVWVEENGDICFYIGKTDSWGDNGRLKKVGKVRVRTNPAIVFTDADFKQELDLLSGTIQITSSGQIAGEKVDFNLQVWVDANNPVIHVNHESSIPLELSAEIELWRTEPYSLPELTAGDLLPGTNRSKPGDLYKPAIVEPDIIIKNTSDYIGWFHHNKKSVGFDRTNKLQGLSEYFDEDPILHRTFGAIITGTESVRVDDKTLQTAQAKTGMLNVYVLTRHPSQPEEWQTAIEEISAWTETVPFWERRRAHEKWWTGFWNRSWIHAIPAEGIENSEENDAFIVSRAYALQRFMNASAGRGNHPIKFNGSIFTVPSDEGEGLVDPDYRRWGPGFWWQNTRLPYYSMCASGDFDLMQPLFDMYADEVYKLSRFRTEKYFGFDGVFYPETIYFWGSVRTVAYGWTPFEEREDPLQEGLHHKREWVAGPELVFMMLDYYDHIHDHDFLANKIIPVANDVMKFFDNYYSTNDEGKWVMYPSQALETWWDCTNPMPEIAGLHSIAKRLLALPESLTSEQNRHFWASISLKIPDIPVRDTPSGTALAPAERFENKRNMENPELYGVFPFRLFGVGRPDIDWGKNALEHRWDRGSFGWRQDDLFMAYLGLTDQAKEYLINRSKHHHKDFRFPAIWGPSFNEIPDQDHGGVLMKAFQSMLLQADPYSEKIYLMPAWPADWNAGFKLHAPYNTTIEGVVKNGEIESLKVTPPSRKKDVIVINK